MNSRNLSIMRGWVWCSLILGTIAAVGPVRSQEVSASTEDSLDQLIQSIEALNLDPGQARALSTQIETRSELERIDQEIRRLDQELKRLKESKSAFEGQLSSASPSPANTVSSEEYEFFETNIRPVLVENCFECHGPEKQKGGLRLDSSEALLRGGDSGPVVFPGDPVGSPLIKAIHYQDPSLQMPPSGKLSDAILQNFEEWIRQGSPYPPSQIEASPSVQPRSLDLNEARSFWSFKPLAHATPPIVRDIDWVQSPVDAFVAAEMERRGIAHAPRADKRTLIRRVTFDLTGLPPTPQEVEDFLSDSSPDAFAKVVDRLLASPHYGERWGRHWLDVVRYTDSFDSRATVEQDVSESYRYRDWVVKAFNEDMPYDRFLQYQIAGDLLPPTNPEDGSFNPEGIIATGMLAIGNWPGGDADKEKMVTDIVDDQIDVIARGMLGLTVACARCHDHKFDPITTDDYYSLAGIFFSSHILPGPGRKTEGSPVLRIPLLSPQELEARNAEEARMAEIEKEIVSIEQNQKRARIVEALPEISDYLVATRSLRQSVDPGQASSRRSWVEENELDSETFESWLRYLGYEKSQLLSKPVSNIHDKPGLHAWVGAQDASSLTVNTNESELAYLSIIHPARAVAVHPSPQNEVAVSWRCPESDQYHVTGRVKDLDSSCGDGISWSLQLATTGDEEILCQGNFINGGEELFSNAAGADSLTSLALNQGDLLTLSIAPKSSHSCDTTLIDFMISSVSASDRYWDLTEDVIADVLQENPHSDRYGNHQVWSFSESTENGGSVAGGVKLLEAWEREIGKISLEPGTSQVLDEVVRQASDRLAQKLVHFATLDATGQAAAEHQQIAPLFADLASDQGPFEKTFDPAHLGSEERGRWKALTEELAALKAKPRPALEYANGIQEGGVPDTPYAGIQDVRVHIRGRYDRLGDLRPRGFPALLAIENSIPIEEGRSGRLELARWVSSASNPLTPRVIANRVWQHHFGEGLARTPGNFGKLGEAPTHPELLDWLARDLIENGWSIKSLHRRILLSSTYQQSSKPSQLALETDPDNLWLSHQNRRRLEAESIRDAMHQVSGRLEKTLGGPPFRDLSTPRRTLYFKTVRSDRTSFNMLFDGADPTAVVDRRIGTTVAPQALFLLNHPFVLEMADSLAQRVLVTGQGDPAQRIADLYENLFSRSVSPEELEIGMTLVSDELQKDVNRWKSYCQVLLCANEFVFID